MEIASACAIGLENESSGFTPVRRKLSTINTRHAQSELEVEWTATRCNRLLRALTSRVAVLRKDLSRYQSNKTSRSHTSDDSVPKAQPKHTVQVGDTSWTKAGKRIKRTYSARVGGKAGGKAGGRTISGMSRPISTKDVAGLIPGEVSVPTPLLNRARGDFPVSDLPIAALVQEESLRQAENRSKKRPRTKDGEVHFQLSQMMRQLKRNTSPSRYSIYEGIYSGLETLLKATKPDKPKQQKRGSRSLLSMCLEAVPRYISKQELLLETQLEETGKRSAINSRDVSTEIYDDLEAFGSFGRGWKHLSTIVRSHGLQVISDAIQAELLDVEFCGILVTLCTYLEAGKEAEILISSLLSLQQIPAPKNLFTRFGDNDQSRPLSILWNFVEKQQCFSYQYRAISTMIVTGHLPLQWVATKEFAPIWTRAIHRLSSDATETNTFLFMDTLLSVLAGMRNTEYYETNNFKRQESFLFEATKQTFSSILTTLVSIIILSKETATQTHQNSDLMVSNHKDISNLLQSSLVNWKFSHTTDSHGALLLLASLVTENQDIQYQFANLDLLLNHFGQAKRATHELILKDDLVAFVCSVARCCGRGAFTSGFSYLAYLHLILENLANVGELEEGTVLHRIIVDSAFAFAEQSPDRKHFEYAASVEAKFHLVKTELSENPTPASRDRQARAGYRWEEGISEWVTATPAATNSCGTIEASVLASPGETEYDTPLKPMRRKFNRAGVISQTISRIISSPLSTDNHDLYGHIGGDTPEYKTADPEETYNESLTDSSPRSIPTRLDYHEDSADETDNEGSADETDSFDEIRNKPASTRSSGSESEIFTSPGQSEHIYLGRSCPASVSSPISHSGSNSRGGRHYIDRAPRLSRRVLRHNLQWQLFEESEDELSFQSVSSSQGEQALPDITNIPIPNRLREGKSYTIKRQKPSMNLDISLLGESEDELCI